MVTTAEEKETTHDAIRFAVTFDGATDVVADTFTTLKKVNLVAIETVATADSDRATPRRTAATDAEAIWTVLPTDLDLVTAEAAATTSFLATSFGWVTEEATDTEAIDRLTARRNVVADVDETWAILPARRDPLTADAAPMTRLLAAPFRDVTNGATTTGIFLIKVKAEIAELANATASRFKADLESPVAE